MSNSKHPLYRRYNYIQQVTENPNNPDFHRYGGGQGIKNMFRSFEDFADHIESTIGLPPTPQHRLHRIDQQDHFAPGNFEWTNQKGVSRNQRSNVKITYKGETKCVTEWCEILDLNYRTVFERLRMGWDVKDALRKPVRYVGPRSNPNWEPQRGK
jgi:hypothetical protein